LDDYRVRLDAYNGPMDLLLYLIRKDEVDIYDIPIARIAEQYQQYLELLQALDVNLAGEFLVLAATLMEIKSRMLLPHPPPLAEGEEEDPRMELVRELLEYKRFRDAAEGLKERADVQQLKFPRLARPEVPAEEPSAKPLHEVEL
jgi:segregation and condensation protein A